MELAFILAGWQIHEKGRHVGSMTLVVMYMKNPGVPQCGNKPLKQWQGLMLRRGHCKEQRQQCPGSDERCLHPGPLPEPLSPVYSCAQFSVSVSSSFACVRVSGGVLSQTLRPVHTDWTVGVLVVIIGVCLVLGVSGISADDSLLVVKPPCRLNESFFPVISRK